MNKTTSLTEKDVHARLPKDLLKKLRSEFEPPTLKAFTATAIAAAPEDVVSVAVRLVQMSGRIPSAADLEFIRGAPAPAQEAPAVSLQD